MTANEKRADRKPSGETATDGQRNWSQHRKKNDMKIENNSTQELVNRFRRMGDEQFMSEAVSEAGLGVVLLALTASVENLIDSVVNTESRDELRRIHSHLCAACEEVNNE